jgi:RimJ/RimL family protein N-acetyltransferase
MTQHYLRKLNDKMGEAEYKMYRAIPAEEVGMENPCHHMSYDEWREWLKNEISQNEYATYIMYKEDYPIGHITITFDTEIDGGNLSYEIRPVCRSRGLSSVMLGLAVAEARNLGVGKVVSFVNKVNAASWHTLEKCGFTLTKETEWDKYYELDLGGED